MNVLGQAVYITQEARFGKVWINGVPSTQIDRCVVDRERGTVIFGTYADALRSRFDSTKRPPRGRASVK